MGAGFCAPASVAWPARAAAETSRTGRMEESSRDEGTDPAASGGHERTLRDGGRQRAVGFLASNSRAGHSETLTYRPMRDLLERLRVAPRPHYWVEPELG